MTGIVSNYVSSEELTLWLAEKQNDIYGDMREAIDLSNERSQMQSELSTIKQHLEEANASGDFEKVSQEISAFLSAHGTNPEFEEVSGPLNEINASIHAHFPDGIPSWERVDQFANEADLEDAAEDFDGLSTGNGPALLPDLPGLDDLPLQFSDQQLKSWIDAIGSKIDFLSQQDQLAMIRIQELNGQVNQSEQLVSNLLASQNQTQNAVISNIRG
jgi:hypothetical protein